MNLQYQLSNGNWTNCDGRTEEFLQRIENHTGLSRDDVISALMAGREMPHDTGYWYANCRSLTAYEARMAARRAAQPAPEMVKCACGHTVPKGSVMNASLGTSCPACYDRMSG